MKPKIKKENNFWKLTYYYRARSFNLFGMNKEERELFQKGCKRSVLFKTWSGAINYLKNTQEILFLK